jgi:thioredoxin reductase
MFLVTDNEGNIYKSSRLIVATGVSKPYVPTITGIETAEQYISVSVDPAGFSDQRVLIIGKGNSAFETAHNLIETAATIHIVSPHPIKMAWESHFVGHLRAVNNDFLDSYQLKCQNAVLDAELESLERVGAGIRVRLAYSHAHGERESLVYDRVILCTGFRFDDSMFESSCSPSLTCGGRFPEQTAEWQSTNVPDLYFAGTLTQARDYKRTNSGFIHGFRYNTRCLFRMMEEKYHGVSWPRRVIPQASDVLARAILDRVNRSSALWQQFGFLSDICQLSWRSGEATYYEEMPIEYARERFSQEPYLCIALEFGHTEGSPFSTLRHPDPRLAERSSFLHPVVRYFENSEMVAEHHILEDLSGEWRKEQVHVRPLREFLESVALEPA